MKKIIASYILTSIIIASMFIISAQREEKSINEPFKNTIVKSDDPIIIPENKIKCNSIDVTPKVEEAIEETTNEFTYDEAQMLMRIAQAEAGNQGSDGMWMVMSVVYNRLKDETYPNTIKEVIFQENQFSSVTDGNYYNVKISPEAHQALALIEEGVVAPNIIGFETTNQETLTRFFDKGYDHKDHRFYVKKQNENNT